MLNRGKHLERRLELQGIFSTRAELSVLRERSLAEEPGSKTQNLGCTTSHGPIPLLPTPSCPLQAWQFQWTRDSPAALKAGPGRLSGFSAEPFLRC